MKWVDEVGGWGGVDELVDELEEMKKFWYFVVIEYAPVSNNVL